MTQESLAAIAQADVKTIRKAESSGKRIDLKVIVGIAHALQTEPDELIVRQPIGVASAECLVERVKQWSDAFVRADIDSLLKLHTPDSILELPGSDDLPEAGFYQGLEALAEHFSKMFSLFRLRHMISDSLKHHVSDNFVFMRVTVEFEYLPAAKTYQAIHFNEFEFEGDLIRRRVSSADYGDLRKLLADQGSVPSVNSSTGPLP
jgi:hypothetical protein